MPYFSIIIPSFNSAKTISIALESVLNQSFGDFEILIIDGLSMDKTLDVAQSFKDNRIKIHSEKDEGIYDAMNKGISLAKGNWLFFMGSDDRLYSPHVLSEISKRTKQKKVEVVYGDVYSRRFEGRYDGEFTSEKILVKNICHQSIFFQKTLFERIGDFDLRYKAWADWDHNMRWMLSSEINKVYVECIVSEYADGGFSSLNGDPVFHGEKVLKYLHYGRRTIKFKKKMKVLFRELKRTALYDKRIFLKLLLNIPHFFCVFPQKR